MSLSTIIRVKRRLEDNPQDALLLVCKRRKTDTEELDPSLFVFRGTVNNLESVAVKNVVHKNAIQHPVSSVKDIIEKIRKERKQQSIESRYEIVRCSRGIQESENEDQKDEFDLVDLQPKETDNDFVEYAYDLYTSTKEDFDVSMIDQLVRIENLENSLIFGSNRDNGRHTPSTEGGDDDEDSNDENHWRHDYPDTETSSFGEEDMVKAVQTRYGDDNLSSDENEDIYNEPADLFNSDVKNYGQAYARYKAKVMSERPENGFVHSTNVKDMEELALEDCDEGSDDGFYYGQEDDYKEHGDRLFDFT